MRFFASVVLAALGALAQNQTSPGLVRGRILERDTTDSGELSVRAAGNQVFRFQFDPKTYVERDKQRTRASLLQKGDEVEIVSDLGPPNTLRYARTIHVVEAEQSRHAPLSLGRYRVPRASRAWLDEVAPRGTLTFSGLIARLNSGRMVLRTRSEGEKVIYLRADTRYVQGGAQVQASALRPNTRVFVRGSRNLDNEIEAYQVVWGAILMPDEPR